MKTFEKKRALLMFVLFPVLMLADHFGVSQTLAAGVGAGILGGLSVILFPDPDRRP
ncbi:MAG: hypothetical protein HQM10_06135 [Candidatus Riflebacteria bacterium]|nr:hypothetical protein [Candidatus Riflebacteria bacterium]